VSRALASSLLGLALSSALAPGIAPIAAESLFAQNPTTAGNAAGPEDSAPKEPLPPILQAGCTLSNASATKLAQNNGDLLFTVSYQGCQLSVSGEGLVSASVNVEVMLNLESEVSKCRAFKVALLWELTATVGTSRWGPVHVMSSTVPLENLSGDKKDFSYFSLHQRPPDVAVRLRDIIWAPLGSPSFPDYYWGPATVIQPTVAGSLPEIIRTQLPSEHDQALGAGPDLQVGLTVKAYEPRGWCIYGDADSQPLDLKIVKDT
jgi:hypothetical protein